METYLVFKHWVFPSFLIEIESFLEDEIRPTSVTDTHVGQSSGFPAGRGSLFKIHPLINHNFHFISNNLESWEASAAEAPWQQGKT